MEESRSDKRQRVTQIGFKVIPEDGVAVCINCTSSDHNNSSSQSRAAATDDNDLRRKRRKKMSQLEKKQQEQLQQELQYQQHQQRLKLASPNFTFECAYPAVVFSEVCFSIDKSQQQANFYHECIYRLRTTLTKPDESDQRVEILKSINLTVPSGSIFGLLGPSSCGKTTLLRCLVGLLRPNSGFIQLFSRGLEKEKTSGCCGGGAKEKLGRRSSNCKVPGANVGYMPQDLGLYEDFTIRQLLTMFGQFMRMDSKLIETRIDFMAQFLDLPGVDREICSLSGGQKRRVSFAIACLHMPPLIILDEPTVGVDPLLRQSIWKYLRRLADEENKTIIITTHYIEEAAQADQVALMRAGEILVQDAPRRIMEANGCSTLEEAFLKICNNVQLKQQQQERGEKSHQLKLYPRSKFDWHERLEGADNEKKISREVVELQAPPIFIVPTTRQGDDDAIVNYDNQFLDDKKEKKSESEIQDDNRVPRATDLSGRHINNESSHLAQMETTANNELTANGIIGEQQARKRLTKTTVTTITTNANNASQQQVNEELKPSEKIRSFRENKLVLNDASRDYNQYFSKKFDQNNGKFYPHDSKHQVSTHDDYDNKRSFRQRLDGALLLAWALLHKNYRRNMNSLPLLAFQFMLPIVQMISFSLCVGGRPMDIGLGIVNLDQPMRSDLLMSSASTTLLGNSTGNDTSAFNDTSLDYDYTNSGYDGDGLLSLKYLSFVDHDMISVRAYSNLSDALRDVREAKLWAAMEIGKNFTTSLLQRFDIDSLDQFNLDTIQQSIIKLYPDRSNKVLDMICHRSLVQSYRRFASEQFEQFKRLPIEVKEPIFEIKPNLISNSIDGYTESIAAGLLASLTYIMAAGLTTFIMVVERSAGILERTYTSGISPVGYLLAHAIFRSLVMMAQIALVLFLTFYILKQPLLGSIWLAYLMLMTLNLTGISYGLLISSIVTDQNGAALTIVSSLVVKITMSGILWPYEAIPRWLRVICYVQPLTMPVQALKAITLKGSGLEDRAVYLGFLVSLTWLTLFLTIAAKRFRFYQF